MPLSDPWAIEENRRILEEREAGLKKARETFADPDPPIGDVNTVYALQFSDHVYVSVDDVENIRRLIAQAGKKVTWEAPSEDLPGRILVKYE